MRIGMVGPALGASGGIAAVASSLLDGPGLEGVDVRYFASVAEGSGLEKAGSIAAGQAALFAALARGYRADVWHIHVGAPLIPGRGLATVARFTSFWRKLAWFLEARATGRPVVLHVHGSDGFVGLHEASRASAWITEAVLSRCASVVVVSRKMEGVVRGWLGPDAPIATVYNPVDVGLYRPSPLPEAPTVLFMGLVGAAKGAWDLLAAIPDVARRVPDVRFRFAGNGDVAGLRAEARRLGVDDRVEVLGWISGEAKRRALEDATVYCLPSYFEGLPVGVLEAMASARPVVATAIAGIPEAVEDGRAGFLVEPGDRAALADRLVRVLSDRELAARLGEAGREKAEVEFGRDVVVRRLRAVWETAAKD